MNRRIFAALALSVSVVLGCSLSVKPATAARPVVAGSMDRAMRAALAAASATNWVTKTASAETGYYLAEREERVTGRGDRSDAYKLEVIIPTGGSGSISVKVTPPPGIIGGENPSSMAAKFLDAFELALKK